MSLGSKIKDARINLKMTQTQLADLIGVSFNSISDWENDKHKPDIDYLIPLCKSLNVDANYLLSWNEEKNTIDKNNFDYHKKILKEKGLMDENDNINEENFNKLMKFAEFMKEINKEV